jgi:hypothetical protein
MTQFLKQAIRNVLHRFGYDIVSFDPTAARHFPEDIDTTTKDIFNLVRPYTMTGPERVFALRQAVHYVIHNRIPGGIVECGVWKGGSMIAVARTMMELGVSDRYLWLYDTFDGMSEPSSHDVSLGGETAFELLAKSDKETSSVWAFAPLDEVRQNLHSTGYPEDKILYVQGKVEETIPGNAPEQISILRLDTDWYESTRHELVNLYPRLSPGGVLIIDDYGHWAGSQKAVDEYFLNMPDRPLLNRIDYCSRLCIKNSTS